MTYLSSVYVFFYIGPGEERKYLGFCKESEFEDYLDELLANGYLMDDLTWDTEL
jgi:hypothetical protein